MARRDDARAADSRRNGGRARHVDGSIRMTNADHAK
jgi:hypothetical protein